MRASGRESFEDWARSRQQTLVRNAFLVTGDFQHAEDLVQEALIRAAGRWDVLRDGNPDGWVRTVVYRQHVSWWRRSGRETTVAVMPDSPVAAPGLNSLVLAQALAQLTRRQRAVVVLRYVEDLSEVATAELLGVTVGTVKKQAHTALRRLRQVAPELEEPLEEHT